MAERREKIAKSGGSFDLVLMGASEVYSDFAPGYAYAKSGVRSYLYSTQSNTILNYKSQLKNILSRQKPDVILIELNGALYNDDTEVTKEANFRNYADNVPIPDKWEWMWQNNVPNKGEYLFLYFVGSDNDKGWEQMGRQLIAELCRYFSLEIPETESQAGCSTVHV